MKKLFVLLILLILTYNVTPTIKDYTFKINQVKKAAKNKKLNTNYCILIDFSKFSGEKRMHLVNLKNYNIESSFLVAKGRGKEEFSNVAESNCSSLGMVVIGEKGHSNYGTGFKYILNGLEKTNSNVKRRNIVLHSWGGIPPFSIFPIPLYQSKGCPTVANKTLIEIDKLIKSQINKKIIIYTFK